MSSRHCFCSDAETSTRHHKGAQQHKEIEKPDEVTPQGAHEYTGGSGLRTFLSLPTQPLRCPAIGSERRNWETGSRFMKPHGVMPGRLFLWNKGALVA